MKHGITIVILTMCCIVNACASSEPGQTIKNRDEWIDKSVIACSEAQMQIGNPIWDTSTGLPKNPDFDKVYVQFLGGVSYFVVQIGFKEVYPGVPSAFCHLSTANGNVLWAGYSAGEMITTEHKFEEYILVNEIEKLEARPVESLEFSLRQVTQERLSVRE